MVAEREERYFKKTRPEWAIGLGHYLPGVVDDSGKKLVPYIYYVFQDKPGFYVGKKTYCGLMVRAGRAGISYPWVHLTGYFGIKYDDKDCGSAYNKGFTPIEYQAIEGEFDLPNEAETIITFHGGHEVEGKWKEDFAVTVPIRPMDYDPSAKPPSKPPLPVKCKQWFKVVDETGRGLGTLSLDPKTKNVLDLPATIEIFDIDYGVVEVKSGVFGGGVYRWNLIRGRKYRVKAWVEPIEGREDYKCIDCEKEFVACTEEIVLTLKAPPGWCTQAVKVVYDTDEQKSIPCDKATVTFVGGGERIEGANVAPGVYKAGLIREGISYTVTAKKTGYDCIDCKRTFTACTKEILLRLKYARVAKIACAQTVKVVDEKGKPIGGASVHFPRIPPKYTGVDGIVRRSLASGEECTAKAEKTGYECVDCEKTFVPIAPEWTGRVQPCVKPGIVVLTLKRVGKCTQWVKVVDEKGVPIPNVDVEIPGVRHDITGPYAGRELGKISFSLTEGKKHTVTSFKHGYECVDCERAFTACTKEIVLTFKKKVVVPRPKMCTQWVKVVNEKGVPIGATTVIFKGVGKKFTGGDGRTSVSLEEDKSYTVIAEKEGYECIDCEKTFTACTKELVLTLKKTIVLPGKCTQWVKVVDEKGVPIKDAYVGFFTDGLFTRPSSGADGRASASLEEGKVYILKVEGVGYAPSETKFTACTDEITITLPKPAPPATCTQSFKVETEKGEPVGVATVTVIGVGKKFTDAKGKTQIVLTKGTSYTVVTEKGEYECIDCEKTFTACTEKTIVLILRRPKRELKEKCTQPFKVVGEKGNPIKGATVRINKVKKTTDDRGRASMDLRIGAKYKVIASAWGFDCLDCGKEFTACTEEIVLSLKRKTGKCAQGFRVIRVIDKEKKPIEGATISVFANDKLIRSATTKRDGRWALYLDWWKVHTIKAEKAGYKCIECEKEFTACTEKVIYLVVSK